MKHLSKLAYVLAIICCLSVNKSNAAPGAVNLNGANSFIDIGIVLQGGHSYTKEAWIYANGNQSYNIITGGDDPFWLNGGHLRAAHHWTGQYTDVQDTATFPLGVWTHVAVTYDASISTMKLYKNGVLVATNTNASTYNTSFEQVGAYNDGNVFSGNIDEVRIWDRALCAPELQLHMNVELKGTEPGLLVYYNFNVGIPGLSNLGLTTITNLTGKGFNGTLKGFSLAGTVANIVDGKTFTGTYQDFVFPTASITSGTPGASTVLTANNSVAYQWIKDSIDISGATSQTYTAAPGIYKVRITASNGCVNTSAPLTVTAPVVNTVSGTITVSPNPTIAGQDSFTIYDGYGPQTVKLSITGSGGTAPYTYKWSNNSTSTYIWVSPDVTTIYSCLVTDANGNTKTVSITIEVEAVKDCWGRFYMCHSHRNNSYWSYFSHWYGYSSSWDVDYHLGHGDKLGRCGNHKSTQEPIDLSAFKYAAYPNPTRGEMEITLPETGHTEIIIADVTGKVVMTKSFEPVDQKFHLDMSNVQAGIYMMSVDNGGAKFQTQIIKQ
ncbi:MAG: T9SS type A sorting domain-containing protein [Bacteroidetes bacterium]|nr:T9SS type A sorting domain-containing protein [Bacteroidota bacterium]